MKTRALLGWAIPAVVLFALCRCSGQEEGGVLTGYEDSLAYAQQESMHTTLENLLGVKDEADLVKRYGKENVKYDTIWGAEGFFSMGTILKTEEASHIEITWMNDSLKTDIVSVTQVSDSDWYSDTLSKSAWKSSTGVCVGMTHETLQKINGRVFTFSGFGWDYAGGVISWNGGTLEGKGLAVQLSEAPATFTWTPEQTAQVLGDVEVQSDNPLLKELQPRVWSISVAKVQ